MATRLSGTSALKAGRSGEPALIQITDLTAGIDRRVAVTQVAPDRARRLRNVKIAVAGEWQPRAGWTTHHTASLGADRGQGAARIYLENTTPFSLWAWHGNVYRPTDAGVVGAAVLTGLSTVNEIYFAHDAELVAVFDGAHTPKKSLDGTTWTQMGITPPPAPTAAAVAGGSLVVGNTYRVSAVYRGAHTTSNESGTADAAVIAGNRIVRVTVVASADPQVTDIDIYAQDLTAGETVRRYAGSRTNTNGTVDLTVNNWSAAEEAPTRRNVAPALAFGAPWKNRWWAVDAADRTILRFTEIFENQSWPPLYYIDIPFTRGDAITAIMPLGDVLVVFGYAKQAFLIIGQTSLDFEVRPSGSIEGGCLGPRACDRVENNVIHAAAEGVFLFDGASDRLLSFDFEHDWRLMAAAASTPTLARVPLIYHRRDKEVRIAVPVLPTYGTAGEWVLDLARTQVKDVAAWTTTDRTIGGYVQWDGVEPTTGNHGRIFSWSDSIGRMFEESTGTSANGADLIADYEGPGLTAQLRVARFLEVYVDANQAEGALSITTKVDDIDVLTETLDISGIFAEYGTARYGIDRYSGATRTMIPVLLPIEAEGRAIQVRFEYQGQDTFTLFGYGVALVPEPELRGMR